MPTLTFPIFSGTGNASTGDASVNSSGTQGFNPQVATGFLGRVDKSNPEFNVFMAFDISAIPRGSRFDGTNLEFRTSTAPQGTVGSFRIGYLLQDGIWDVSGFANAFSPAPFYVDSFEFPNPIAGRTAIPHATQDGSATVELEIIFFNAFPSGEITYGPGREIVEGETRFAIGEGIGGEDVVASINTLLQANRNFEPGSPNGIIGLTLDSSALGAVVASLDMYFEESTTSSFRPTLVVAFTENPPFFTSVPIVLAHVDVPYTYQATAAPWSLGSLIGAGGDTPTPVLTFSLVSGPVGLTITSSGLVEWVPTLAQLGDNPVTIRVTNDIGGLTADQAFMIQVDEVLGCPDGVAQARRAVSGQTRHQNAVSGEARSNPAVTGQAQVRPAVTGRAIVRRAVSGFARRCSKE